MIFARDIKIPSTTGNNAPLNNRRSAFSIKGHASEEMGRSSCNFHVKKELLYHHHSQKITSMEFRKVVFHIKCPDLMARLALLRIWNKLNLSVAAKCSWKDWLTSICLLHPFHCMEMSQSVKSLLASMLLQLFPTCSKTCKKKQLTGERKLRES